GYLETALVRFTDEIVRPDRNRAPHEYYMCLNRKVDKGYVDRSAAFVSLASTVIVPSIDWAMASPNGEFPDLRADRLGVEINGEQAYGGREWDDDTQAFVDLILDNRGLSIESLRHASQVDLRDIEVTDRAALLDDRDRIERNVARHYLCRLLLQVRAAAASDARLVLAEPDCDVLNDVGAFVTRTGLAAPFPLPDLSGRALAAESFAGALLNFAPNDALALAKVKLDPKVRAYAAKVASFFEAEDTLEAERELLAATKLAHDQADAGRKAQTIFEVVSWIVKPLHYVPGAGEVLTVAEDLKDAIALWTRRKTEATEWRVIGAKMRDIAYDDWLSRKGNL
ncbi:MAG TPA: hypothetical protein VKQ70_16730, partial [Caulobacteraceae bacterium]|nr:hypothetical protein [Caulobacteraceae bacterium]